MCRRLIFLGLMFLGCATKQRQYQNFSKAFQYSNKMLEEEKKFYALANENTINDNVVKNNIDNNQNSNICKFNIEKKKLSSTNWMDGLDGSKKLNQFNIPGSHDSLAYNVSNFVKKYAQCQKYTLQDQLNSGVRILDIRLFYDKTKKDLFCCHGKDIFQCNCHKKNSDELISYDLVLSTIANFLKNHPSETIIIAPKHESGSKTLTNKQINLVHEKLKKFGIIYTENRVPSLQEVRGKIVLWDKKNSLNGGMKILTTSKSFSNKKYIGIKWEIQKKFKTTPQEKVNILQKFFNNAENNKQPQDGNHGYINYSSGFDSILLLPNSASVAKDVNIVIKNHKFKNRCLYGWIIGDFVDEDFAKAIYISNFVTPF